MSRYTRDRGNAQTPAPEEDVTVHVPAEVRVPGRHRGFTDDLFIASNGAGISHEGMRCGADLPPVIESSEEDQGKLPIVRTVAVRIVGRSRYRTCEYGECSHEKGASGYPPSWFTGRIVSLKTRWEELNTPQASDQLSLAL